MVMMMMMVRSLCCVLFFPLGTREREDREKGEEIEMEREGKKHRTCTQHDSFASPCRRATIVFVFKKTYTQGNEKKKKKSGVVREGEGEETNHRKPIVITRAVEGKKQKHKPTCRPAD